MEINYFCLCPTTKKELKEKHFAMGIPVVKALEAILKHMAKGGFWNIFLKWQRCCKKCAALHGDHFERNRTVNVQFFIIKVSEQSESLSNGHHSNKIVV